MSAGSASPRPKRSGRSSTSRSVHSWPSSRRVLFDEGCWLNEPIARRTKSPRGAASVAQQTRSRRASSAHALVSRPCAEPAAGSQPQRRATPRVALCLSGGQGRVTLRAWTRRGYRALDEADDRARAPAAWRRARCPRARGPLASAGARWWKKKRARNPNFQTEAIAALKETERTLRALGGNLRHPHARVAHDSEAVEGAQRRSFLRTLLGLLARRL